MKVSGPGSVGDAQGARETEGASPNQGADAVERDAEAFANQLGRAGTASASEAAAPAAPASPADRLTADLADDLRAGRVGADAALEQVVERIIDAQIGADAPAAVRDSLRATLRDALENDPFVAELAAKLRQVQSA